MIIILLLVIILFYYLISIIYTIDYFDRFENEKCTKLK